MFGRTLMMAEKPPPTKYITGISATVGTGATFTMAVPATAQAGDLAMFITRGVRMSGGVTGGAGSTWTRVATFGGVEFTWAIIGASDVGATLTISKISGDAGHVALVIFRNAALVTLQTNQTERRAHRSERPGLRQGA
jgi:hypothetical protein